MHTIVILELYTYTFHTDFTPFFIYRCPRKMFFSFCTFQPPKWQLGLASNAISTLQLLINRWVVLLLSCSMRYAQKHVKILSVWYVVRGLFSVLFFLNYYKKIKKNGKKLKKCSARSGLSGGDRIISKFWRYFVDILCLLINILFTMYIFLLD